MSELELTILYFISIGCMLGGFTLAAVSLVRFFYYKKKKVYRFLLFATGVFLVEIGVMIFFYVMGEGARARH